MASQCRDKDMSTIATNIIRCLDEGVRTLREEGDLGLGFGLWARFGRAETAEAHRGRIWPALWNLLKMLIQFAQRVMPQDVITMGILVQLMTAIIERCKLYQGGDDSLGKCDRI